MDKKITWPRVSIAITNWNGKEYLRSCLKSVQKIRYTKGLLEVLVIDNASTDKSCEMISKEFPRVRLYRNKKNIGFSAGMNIGFKYAKGDYILALNNDVILSRNFLSQLVKAALQDDKIAAVGGQVYHFGSRGKIEPSWGRIDRKSMNIYKPDSAEEEKVRTELVRTQGIKEVDYILFLCLLKKRCLKLVGLLDERFFSTFEDTDLMVRLKDRGFKIVYCPIAKIRHKGAVSFGSDSPKLIYYLQRNSILARSKYNHFSLFDHCRNLSLLISLIISLISAKNKLRYYAAARGVIDFYLQKFGEAPEFIK